MASTLRFDKWENTLGAPYGTVLQVKTVRTEARTTYSSATSGKRNNCDRFKLNNYSKIFK